MLTIGPGRPTPAIRAIIAATIVVFVLQLIAPTANAVYSLGVLIPSRVFGHGELWRLVTYMLLHSPANPFHIVFNMLTLWMFGTELERRWGARRFVTFYVVCGAAAALFSAFMWNSHIIGASGAVLALLTAFAFYYPHQQILMFLVLPIPVWLAVALIGVISLVSSRLDSGVAHLTHLGGILAALLWLGAPKFAGPWFSRVIAQYGHFRAEQRAQISAAQNRYFEQTIDPILKKISEHGMESLSKREKELLFEASRKNRERFNRGRIIPFDFK